MSNRYGMYSAFFDDGAGGLALNQAQSIGTRTNKQMTTIRPSGALDPAVHLMSSARPAIAFQTRDWESVLAKVSLTVGLAVSGTSTFMYRRRVPGGAYSTGNTHLVQTVESGFLHITEMSGVAEADDACPMQCEFVALSSDGDNPFTVVDDQAIPGALTAPAFNSAFYMGPVYFNGSILRGLTSIRIRPGLGFRANFEDGGAFPRYDASCINARGPMIETTFAKVDMVDSVIGDIMVGAFTQTLASYWQQGSNNSSGRISAATATHIKVSAAAGSWGPEDVSVAGEDDATLTLAIMPTGTLSLSTASAIGA